MSTFVCTMLRRSTEYVPCAWVNTCERLPCTCFSSSISAVAESYGIQGPSLPPLPARDSFHSQTVPKAAGGGASAWRDGCCGWPTGGWCISRFCCGSACLRGDFLCHTHTSSMASAMAHANRDTRNSTSARSIPPRVEAKGERVEELRTGASIAALAPSPRSCFAKLRRVLASCCLQPAF